MRKKVLFIVIVFVLLLFFGKLISLGLKYSPVALQLLFNKSISLNKTDDHINILLLGTGGGTHDGPNLTDTIMFVSIDQQKNTATLISIPRDLWIPDLNGKINTAYAIGEGKQAGGGLILAKAAVSKVIHQQINYGVRVDFDGFVKIIDSLGGIDITVDNTFDDYQYPIEEERENLCGHTLDEATAQIATLSAQVVFPCRYEHVHFEKGLEHMDGKRALIFVRSRYAVGEEGTDFARSRRQAKVLAAVRSKVFSLQTFLNPTKIVDMYTILHQSIDTDIKQDEIDDFIRLAQKMKAATIKNFVIDYGDEHTNRLGLLINPPITEDYGNEWVLVPRIGSGDFSEIQSYVSCVLVQDNCNVKPLPGSSSAPSAKKTLH